MEYSNKISSFEHMISLNVVHLYGCSRVALVYIHLMGDVGHIFFKPLCVSKKFILLMDISEVLVLFGWWELWRIGVIF